MCIYCVASFKSFLEALDGGAIFDKRRPTKGVSPNDGKPYRHTHVVCSNWSKERGEHPGSE